MRRKTRGRYLLATLEKFEGTASLPNVMVVIEFLSMALAHAWAADPEYAPLIKLRQTGCDMEFALAEGL